MDARNRVRALIPILVLFFALSAWGQTATTGVTIINNCAGSHTLSFTHLNGGSFFSTFFEPGCSTASVGVGSGVTFTGTLCPAHTGDEIYASLDSGPSVDTGAAIGAAVSCTLSNSGTCVMTFSNPPLPCVLCNYFTNSGPAPVTFALVIHGVCDSCPAGQSFGADSMIWGPSLMPGDVWAPCLTNSTGGSLSAEVIQVIWAGNGEPFAQPLGVTNNCVTTGGGGTSSGSGGIVLTNHPVGSLTNNVRTNGVFGPVISTPPNTPQSGQGNNTNVTGQQIVNNFNNLNNTLQGGFGWLGKDLNQITNQLNGTGTNSGLGSNVFIMGSYADTNYSQNPGSSTNWLAGTNATWAGKGIGSFGGAWSNGLSFTNAMGAPPTNGVGSRTFLYVSLPDGLGGTTNLSMDPENWFPGVPALIRLLVGWAAGMWFGWWVSSEVRSLSHIYATAELGGVPDLDGEILGVGGNAIGLIVALAVPAIFIALWVGVFVWLFSSAISIIGSHWSDSPFSTLEGFSVYGSAAVYVLNETLPMPLLLSLAWARMTVPAGLAMLVSAGSTVSRFLFGK